MSFKKITSLQQLKDDCCDTQEDYFIWFGYARSSKTIEYDSENDTFIVFNDIDGTDYACKSGELIDYGNVIKAIYNGNFYSYRWEETKINKL